jgi:hypothetical protein
MVGPIVTLLAIGVAAGAGTHRHRFRPVSRARQQPTVAVGPASPTGPVNRDAAQYRSSDPLFSPVRQEPGSRSDRREREGASQTKVKDMPTTELKSPRAEPSTADRTDLTCAVCPHEWDAHDPIGISFCSATVAGRLHRGCVCVGDDCNEDRR